MVRFLDGLAQVEVGGEKDGWNGMDGREWDNDTLVMIYIFCLFLAVMDALSLRENRVGV